MPATYPPAPPAIDGNLLTVDLLLKNPTVIERRVGTLLEQRLLAGRIFANGAPAVGGAVIFDRVLESDLYTTRDVQSIAPGSEFPIVDDAEATPSVAAVEKRGGAAEVTYEQQRRNRLDVVNRKFEKLANTIARKIDTVAMAVLAADSSIPTRVGSAWSNLTSGDPIDDVMTSVSSINNRDLGYVADTVLIHPLDALAMYRRKDIREQLPRENRADNPLLSGNLNGLLGLSWYESNRVPRGETLVLSSQMAGSLHDEVPFYTRTIDVPQREVWLLQAARVTVPVVTDPLAVERITGVNAA